MKGLFQAATLMRTKVYSASARCGACGLYKHCKSPKLEPQGSGSTGVMIVLPPISKPADDSGVFMMSSVGTKVRDVLLDMNISPKNCYVTAATICHTNKPTSEQIDACSFKLRESIKELKPHTVIAIGDAAVRNVIQFTWNKPAGDPHRWYGYQIPAQLTNCWVCPVIEPTNEERQCSGVLFEQQIASALKRRKHPYKENKIPDFHSQVNILDEKEAIRCINHLAENGGTVAWDYETNSLKPEHSKARILAVSFCVGGKYTFAVAWSERVAEAVRAFCRSPRVKKIASNLQFEHRWTQAILKTRVRGWLWDTMQAAHSLDNRQGVTSIKFQSFVQLGQPSYNDKIHDFMTSDDKKEDDSHAVNRIVQDIPMHELLVYCGLDSLLEYKVAVKQARLMEHPAYEEMI
jgi:uracil-DNA glycosylase family 4